MSTNDPARRGFLRSLVTLPLIGGGVTLVSNPTRAAEPVTSDLLDSYNAWLLMERRHLLHERNAGDFFHPNTGGGQYHWRAYGTPDIPPPSTRAAVVLAAVDCDWREIDR